MTATAKSPGTKKDKKEKKESVAPPSTAPKPGAVITLRAAGRALGLALGKKGVAYNDLLSELRSGAIYAGFFMPTDPAIWVAIPSAYWSRVSSDQFSQIQKNSKHNEIGAYKIIMSDFPRECAAAAQESIQGVGLNPSNQMIRLLEECLVRARNRIEVVISTESWEPFVVSDRTRLVDSKRALIPAAETAGRGRKQIGGWRLVNKVLAAYLAKRGTAALEKEKHSDIATTVLQLAADLKKDEQLPGSSSVEKEVGSALELIGRIPG